jgi:hypothetical protein
MPVVFGDCSRQSSGRLSAAADSALLANRERERRINMTELAFVSMPFGDNPDSPENEWTKLYDHGLKPLETGIDGLPDNITHTPIKLWRADKNLKSLSLKINVMRGIDQATFMICVLTTSVVKGTTGLRLTNPNVLWELGYAEALGKPIIVMADDASLSQLPILTGSPNVCQYNHKVVQATKPREAPDALKFIARDLVPYVLMATEEARLGTRHGKPIHHRTRAIAYSNRDAVNLRLLIGNARNQVDILTTNLNYFLFDKMKKEVGPFYEALSRGASVRIVTMNPESVIAEYRAKQLVRGQDIPGYRSELRDGIITLFKLFGDHPQFHLHVYDDLPLQITFRIDEDIITSIATRGERARKRIQVRFSLYDEGATESFVSHFQSMFDNSTDVRGLTWVTEPDKRHSKRTLDASEGLTNQAMEPTVTIDRKKKRVRR